ncbi:GNAT family N-acetyltransferase [Streptomyces althioticus]|uniref:GNAT family N-acetyltransferase n=1 Tax=Streptomyces althioticus TaxID=83380 RepID=UPI0036AC6882
MVAVIPERPAQAAPAADDRQVRVTYREKGSEYWFTTGPAGAPTGYARVVQHHRHTWIDEIAVHPGARGRGLATLLLTAVIERFGHRTIGLHCAPFTPQCWEPRPPGLECDRLLHWYGSHGFEADAFDECMWRPGAR